MQVTTKDIAKICGVSRGTVDRALNGRPDVSGETRELILRAAQQLGYRPNYIAKSLVKGQTMTIGVVIFDLNNRLFAQLINAVEAEARANGYLINLLLTRADPEIERSCLMNLIDRKADGLIILPVNFETKITEVLRVGQVPAVSFGNYISAEFPFVCIDDEAAMADATTFVIERGFRRLVYVSPPLALLGKQNLYAQELRHQGFMRACESADVSTNVIDQKNFLHQIDGLLESDIQKMAILCTSDIFAIQVLQHLKKHGIRMPQDVGVMGFDDIDTLEYISPGLTSVSFPVAEIGRTLVTTLIAKMNGQDVPDRTIVPHKLVVRETM